MENNYQTKKYKIQQITSETDIDYTYRIAFDQPVSYGQFLQVSIPGIGECPISISAFGKDYVELTIRHIGKVTNAIKELTVGDTIRLRGPYGNGFELADFRGHHIVISAGGTGLAPVRSIIQYFRWHPDEIEKLDILIGFKTPADILFKKEVEEWQTVPHMNVTLTVDKNEEGMACHTGFLTEFVPQININDPHNTQVIIVGPPIMMSCTADEFLKIGMPEENMWVSFERNMSCGIGKCGHCRIDETYVCLEGPVFRYSAAKNMID